MALDRKKLIKTLDALACEYGWSLEYCLRLPYSVITELEKAIADRKIQELKMKTRLNAAAVSAGMSGKMDLLDKIFKEEPEEDDETNEAQWKDQNKLLWTRLGRDPEEFERKWAAGENIVI